MKSHARFRHVAGVCAAVSIFTLLGCSSTQKRTLAAERVPSNGAPAETPTAELPVAEMKQADLEKARGGAIRPACDARISPVVADKDALMAAKAVIDKWTAFKKERPKAPRHGIKTSGEQDPTMAVEAVGMTCGGGINMVEVDGKQYPFDVAWVISGKGASITDGIEDGGEYAMIQALSLKDRRMTVVKIFVPSDASRETDDAFVVANLARMMPEGPVESVDTLVHRIGEKDKPLLETFVAPRGAKSGYYYVAPKQTDRLRARFLGVGRFEIED